MPTPVGFIEVAVEVSPRLPTGLRTIDIAQILSIIPVPPLGTYIDIGLPAERILSTDAYAAVLALISAQQLPSGTVTSVAMNGDNLLLNGVVPGSPITISGTLAPTLKTQPANTAFGNFTGGVAAPTFATGPTVITSLGLQAPIVRFTSALQIITPAGLLTIPHGFASRPVKVWYEFECVIAQLGFVIGDILLGDSVVCSTSGSVGCAIEPDAVNINVRFSNLGNTFSTNNFTTGFSANMTNANWRMRFYAEL